MNLRELQDNINQAIVNYVMKSSTEKKQIIDKIDETYDKIFSKNKYNLLFRITLFTIYFFFSIPMDIQI